MTRQADRAASPRAGSDDIRRLVHDVDDVRIAEILATGATIAEVEAAVIWAAGQTDAMGRSGWPLTGTVAAVYDILTADRDLAEED